ncbi:MAG: hypothetical protein WCI05_15580, partial [Myxococcales bacterium]
VKAEVIDGRTSPPPVCVVAPEVPPILGKLVDSLVAPEPIRRPHSAEEIAWNLERIRQQLAGKLRPLPPENIGPFRGLGRFEETDRDVYFGRSLEVAACIDSLRVRGLVALIGPSGSGKSSLARAGVLPAVLDGALRSPKEWDVVITSPGADPKGAVLEALRSPLGGLPAKTSPESLVGLLSSRGQTTGRGLLLLVDQLEELVTLASGDSQAFLAQLLTLLGSQHIPGVRTLVAARRDLLDPLLALGPLGRVLTRNTQLVSSLSEVTWGEVLDQALEAYGYHIEDDEMRVELLAQLKGTESAMPLVQFALTQLWQRRDPGRKVVPRAALSAIGGIAGALEMHANATLAQVSGLSPLASVRVREILLSLTTAQGTRATRTLVELRQRFAGDVAVSILEVLERARLVVHERDGLTLAHEALLTRWGTLAGWITEAREDRLLAEVIERDAAEWSERGDPDRLWKKRRLVAAEDLVKRGGERVDLSSKAQKFLRASRGAERKARVVLGSVALLLVLGAAGAGGAYLKSIGAKNKQIQQALTATQASEAHAKEERDRALNAEGEAEAARETASVEREKAETARQDFAKKLADLEERVKKAKDAKELAALQAEIRHEKPPVVVPVVRATTAVVPVIPNKPGATAIDPP